MAKSFSTTKVKRFKAEVRTTGEGLGWKVVDVPFIVKEVFGTGAMLPVKGTVNGFPFRTSLFPMKSGYHMLMLNKQMRAGAGGVEAGDTVEITLEHDTEKRTAQIPHQLLVLLKQEGLLKYFKSFNYSTQKWITDIVRQPKSDAAKQRRAEQMAVRLLEVMDGETMTPPILIRAFAGNKRAKEAWESMSPSHRRQHLLGIFSYASPDARERRVARTLKELEKSTNRKSRKQAATVRE
jgi:uncharacterized protein YdeI (YjbR/CyaY-like superfamily)